MTNDLFYPQITESTRSCVCGHVLEDENRYIGGKRFSGIMIIISDQNKRTLKKINSKNSKQNKPLQQQGKRACGQNLATEMDCKLKNNVKLNFVPKLPI